MQKHSKMAGVGAATDLIGSLDAGLSVNLLKYVDMNTLSQSELRAISTSRNEPTAVAASSLIDRFSFNESYGSRRQTYSRLSPNHHHHRHHRLAAPLPKTHSNQPSAPNPGPDSPLFNTELELDRIDCRTILDSLKLLLSSNPDFQLSEPNDLNCLNDIYNNESYQGPAKNDEGETKTRKRGRKPRVSGAELGSNVLVLLNKNKAMVDLEALESKNDPYSEALAKRTSKINEENELLTFFSALSGEWCSRRKRRKLVDADEFGDALPVGWKLLLALRKKDARAGVYCRRYVSPDGQHFATCKDAASYLRSLALSYDVNHEKGYMGDNLCQVALVSPGMFADGQPIRTQQSENDIPMLQYENLVAVEVNDLFECFKCNISFHEKESYLSHLLSAHQKNIRRQRANSVGDGVIIKDGKFECQFCHKVFEEKRRYFSHVGIHVRNYVRGVEDAPGIQMTLQEAPVAVYFPATTSKMDAMVQVARNSIQTASYSSSVEWNSSSPFDISHNLSEVKVNVCSAISGWNNETEASSSSTDSEFDQGNHEGTGTSGTILNLNDECNVVAAMIENNHDSGLVGMSYDKAGVQNRAQCLSARYRTSMFAKPSMVDHSNTAPQVGCQMPTVNLDCNSSRTKYDQRADSNLTFSGTAYQFSHFSSDVVKEQQLLMTTDERRFLMNECKETLSEDLHKLKFTSENMPSAPSISSEKPCDILTQFSFHNFVETTVHKEEVASLCVWCGLEFVQETVDAELLPNSVGYMCLTCKAKTSGRISG